MKSLVLFAHGKESGPWGSKISYLSTIAQRMGAQIISPDYSDLTSPDARVAQLLSLDLPLHDELVLVGSSMGAYVSAVASQPLKPAGLFLLAPAFYLPGYSNQNPVPYADHVAIVHGWSDDVIPPDHSFRFSKQHGCKLHFLPGDHRLTDALQDIGVLFEDFLARELGWDNARESHTP